MGNRSILADYLPCTEHHRHAMMEDLKTAKTKAEVVRTAVSVVQLFVALVTLGILIVVHIL